MNAMMGNHLKYSNYALNENLNRYSNSVLNPIVNDYEPLLRENLEMMQKMQQNFEKFNRFEKMFLFDKFKLNPKNEGLNAFPRYYSGGRNQYNKSPQFSQDENIQKNGNFISSRDDELLNNYMKQNNEGNLDAINNPYNGNHKINKYQRNNFNSNDRKLRDIEHVENIRPTNSPYYVNDNYDHNQNYNQNNESYFEKDYSKAPRVYSFDTNGKLVKNQSK